MADHFANFDWSQARSFLVTAETGSFSAAARQLKTTQPTIGRQVAALEASLGVVLFERTNKGLMPTDAGRDLLGHVKAMGQAAENLALAASGKSEAIDGCVRITASDVLAGYLLPKAVAELRRRAPNLEIDVIAANDLRDLQRREADIAIRHVRPEEPQLIARYLRDATASFYASKSYLEAGNRTERIENLDFIGFGDTDRLLAEFSKIGLTLRRDQIKIQSENGLVAWEMMRSGLGVAVMADEVAEMTPDIVRLPLDHNTISFPIWLVTHRELHTSRRIRLAFDVLIEILAAHQSVPEMQPAPLGAG
ncbi:MAG: LysR family transcriptional regulator [Pseudomonadota bacterium]